jgi:hypothetical protein
LTIVARFDPQERATAEARIEPGNTRRVVRALEVIQLTGKPFSSFGPGLQEYVATVFPVRMVGVWLPRDALDRTFERYWSTVEERAHGSGTSGSYSPYELRNVEALVRLGRRERAYELLTAIFRDQRPAAWNQWAEIVWRDPGAPRFIGDMPHTWVGSSFVRALRTMLAYEREEDRALVLAAGVPAEWLAGGGPGVGVKRLPTYFGVLTYTLRPEGDGAFRLRLSGDLSVPPGGIVLMPPLPRVLTAVTVNGTPLTDFTTDTATIHEFPADVVLEY